ncbi:MAG: MarR family transcriptional regulator [Proteobacteria bacterium]|nr:MarR family transcriptional regulator [Pseudomonadota bacterium]MBU1741662.1 MarR family transcriptional regulator [Pseudomonadota bacterium]
MNIQDCIFFQLANASRHSLRFLGRRLSGLDLTVSQAVALSGLSDQDGVTSKHLGAKIRFDSATLTGVLDRLESTGVIERRPNPDDRRSILVVLTPQGRDLAQAVDAIVQEANRDFVAGLDAGQDRTLRRLLGRLSRD